MRPENRQLAKSWQHQRQELCEERGDPFASNHVGIRTDQAQATSDGPGFTCISSPSAV